MNFTTTHSIQNGIYSTTIAFSSFGGLNIDPIAEQQLLDVEFPTFLDYSTMTFTGKYKYDSVSNNVIADNTGDSINLIPSVQRLLINEKFSVTFQYDTNLVLPSEITTNLPTKEKVCEAKIATFESCINAQITALLTATKAKKDNYLINNPKTEVI